MTLDELIAALTKIRNESSYVTSPAEMGKTVVNVQCPVANHPCRIDTDEPNQESSVRITHGQNESTFVIIEGDIGA